MSVDERADAIDDVRGAPQSFLNRLMQLQSRVLAMSPDTRLKDVLLAIARACNDVLRGDFCVVQPYDATHDRFLFSQFTAAGLPQVEAFPWGKPRPDGATRAALRDGILIVEDYAQATPQYPFLAGQGAFRAAADVRAAIGVRLEAGGENVGVLFVNYLQPHHFSPEDVEIARICANLAAVAVRNARLIELNAVIGAAQDLLQAALETDVDLDAFLTRVLALAQELAPYDVGWLLLREGERLRVCATDQAHRADLGMTYGLDECLSGLAMQRLAPVDIADLAQPPDDLARLVRSSRATTLPMRSGLVVPLTVGGDAIGAVSIESRQPAAFEPRHAEIMTVLAEHAALAIELARSRKEAAAMSAISLELAREAGLPALIRLVLERALALIGGQFGQLMLSEGTDLVVYDTTNDPPADRGSRLMLHGSVCGLAVQERLPVIVSDVTTPQYRAIQLASVAPGSPARVLERTSPSPRYQRSLVAAGEHIRAELVVPMCEGEQVVGVLNVETPRATGFSEAQRAALVELGRTAAAGFVIALAEEDNRALRRLLDAALATADTAFGQILQCAGDHLVIVQTTGSEPLGTRVPVEASVSGRASTRCAEFYVPDVDSEPLYRRYLGGEMKSELVVPLISGDAVIGVLNMESQVPGFFTSEHARILQALAGYAAVAIERARRTEVERLAAIGSLAGDIVHRLNNPLGALSGWIEMLQRKPFYAELIERYPYVAQFVARVGYDTRRAKSIVQELRAELKRFSPAPVDLRSAVNEALERAGLRSSDSKVQAVVSFPPGTVHVMAGPTLSGALWNLFDNARKAMPNGGTLTITVGPGVEPGWVYVEVSDTGVGIEPWRLATLFEAGASTTVDAFAPAHGLGLWWTRAQVESYGGSISVSSQPGQGTNVTVLLRAAL